MLTYFCIYAFLGYCLESIYRSILEKKWISSGLLDCPFIPLYGIGAVILLLYDNYFEFNFIIGGILLTVLELFSSYFIEIIFKIKYWNYEKHFMNFQGRICLLYGCIWILMSYIFYFYIHPFINSNISNNQYINMTSIFTIITIIIKTKKRISCDLS